MLGLLPQWLPNITITDITAKHVKILKKSSSNDFYLGNYRHSTNFHFRKIIEKPGTYKWGVDITILDTEYNRKLILKDTLQFEVDSSKF